MKPLIRLAVERPVGVTVISLAIALLGTVSLTRLAIDLLPEVDVPAISIVTPYDGVAPEEIETLITRPIEQATSTVAGVDRIEATSADGLSRVQLQFAWGSEIEQALDDVRIAVDRAKTFLPDDVETPTVYKFDLASVPIMNLGVTGNDDTRKLKHLAEDDLSRALERLPGVASVQARGGRDREIHVSLDSQRLMALGIGAEQVVAALERENRTVSAGEMKDAGRTVVIRTEGEFASLQDIAGTVVASKNGTPVLVSDLGLVVDSIRKVRSELYIDRQPGIELRIFKQSGANTVEVANEVHAELARLNQRYEGRAQLSALWDSSEYITAAVRGVQLSGALGALLAIAVLLLFLRSWRATLVVATAIPLSVLSSFALIHGQGMTLNLISLGGLALGVGMLVDGSIVILESIYRMRAQGLEAGRAAVEGTHEVATAVIAGTLTTIAVFVPVVFVGDLAGVIFGEMAAVVTFSLLCALVVALTLVPMFSGRILGGRALRETAIGRAIGGFFERLDALYARVIAAALEAPWAIVLASVVVLASSLVMVSRLAVELMPESDEGRVDIDLELPVGTPLETTEEIVLSAEQKSLALLQPGELRHVITSVGPEAWWRPQGSNEGEVELTLVAASQRARGVEEIVQELDRALADLPGAQLRIRSIGSNILTRIIRRGEDRLSVDIYGHDLETFDRLSKRVAEVMRETPGVLFARPNLELGQLERTLHVDRQRAAELGLGSADIATTVEQYVLGKVATRYRDQGDEFDVRVQLSEAERTRLAQLPGLPVVGKQGELVPLHALVQIEETRGPSSISRVNQERVVSVTGGIGDRPFGDVVADLKVRLAQMAVPENFTIQMGGELEEQKKTFFSLLLGVALAVCLVYAVMAVQFESVRHPLVIMASVPFSFIGVALALLVTRTSFNMSSFLGAIMLVGIVVNNAILLVDYTNLLRRRDGTDLRTALVEAGRRRLRPILMTTLTTLFGLLPLALAVGEGSELQSGLARAIVGGLSFSTLVTLVLVPCIYFLMERKRAPLPQLSLRSSDVPAE